MSIKQMTRVWDESPFDGTRLLIHLAMADFAGDGGEFFASQSLLAEKARCSVDYVRKVTREMVELRLLRVIKKGSSVGRATVYQMMWESVKTVNNSPTELGSQDVPTPQLQEGQPPNFGGELPNSIEYHPSYTTILSTTLETAPIPALGDIVPVETLLPVLPAAADAAKRWWESQTVKPIGKGAWHSLVQVCQAAEKAGYSADQIVQALEYIGTVPSMRQMDLVLRGVGVRKTTSAMDNARTALEAASRLMEAGQ